MDSEVLVAIGIFIMSTLIFHYAGAFFKWNEKKWLYLNFIWLFATFMTVVSLVPEIRNITHEFKLRLAESHLKSSESNIEYIKQNAETYPNLSHPQEIEYFGPKEFWGDSNVQDSLRKNYEMMYEAFLRFRPWANNVYISIKNGTSNEEIEKSLNSFETSDELVKDLSDSVKFTANQILASRREYAKMSQYMQAKEYKELGIFLIIFILPFVLGIPVAHNIAKIKKEA